MIRRAHIDPELKQYLLGQLPEARQARVEERVFASDDAHEELLATEEDLIDAYVRNELSDQDRARLESFFLRSPRRVEKVAIARTLAAGLDAAALTSERPRPSSIRQYGWAALAIAASIALVAVVVSLPIRTSQGDRGRDVNLTPDESPAPDRASSPQPAPPAATAPVPVPAPIVVSITLLPGAVRDASAGTRLTIPVDAAAVEADVRFDPVRSASYSAVLRTVNGREVWSGNNLIARTIGNQMSIVLRWPAATLARDDYLLTLAGITSSGQREEIADYYFRVVKSER